MRPGLLCCHYWRLSCGLSEDPREDPDWRGRHYTLTEDTEQRTTGRLYQIINVVTNSPEKMEGPSSLFF